MRASLPRPSRSAVCVALELLALALLFFLLHERLLDYFDPEGSFILTAGERLFKYGVLSTPEYQFFGDTAPSSPYYVAYFFAGLGVLLFGHTSLGAVAYSKFFTLLAVFAAYGAGRSMLGGRLWGWAAAGFVLLFPFARDFATTRPDWTAVFFGWAGLGLLAHALRLAREGLPAAVQVLGKEIDLLWLLPLAAGVSVALAFFSHPLGFQFYMGGGLVLLVGTWGLWRWVLRRETRWFLAGFGAVAALFAVLVINWEKYLYFASQFSSYATQFLPLAEAPANLKTNLARAADPFFFMFKGVPDIADDSWQIRALLAGVCLGGVLAWLLERRQRPVFRPARLLLLLLLQHLFLYVYALPAYRQYIVHALPLLGLLLAAGLRTIPMVAAGAATRLERPARVLVAGILGLALAVPATENFVRSETLFSAPRRYTLIQDAIADLGSVIPPGSRVVCMAREIFLFPDAFARSELVMQQFLQPPLPEYLLREEEQDGIITNPAWYHSFQDQRNLLRNSRYHFLRFVPDYITASQYAAVNCAEPVAEFQYSVRHSPPSKQDLEHMTFRVWKTNYNEWPFRSAPVGARFYPSFSDPVSAMRYREFLMAGAPRPIVKEPPTLRADAGPDIAVRIPLDAEEGEVFLDGSRSWSSDGGIVRYEWEGPWWVDQSVYAFKVLAEGEKARRRFSLGEEINYLKVTDAKGRTSRDQVIVRGEYDTSGLVNYAAAASGGAAWGRSSYSSEPAVAVDGDASPAGLAGVWASARPGDWLGVDLGGPRRIRAVFVRFRNDFPQPSQTEGLVLEAADDPEFRSAEDLGRRAPGAGFPRAGIWKVLLAPEKPRRYLRVRNANGSLVSFAEVEAWCEPGGEARDETAGLVNRALAAAGALAAARASHMGLDPANAVDGKTRGGLTDSWTSEAQADAFWQVDLGAAQDIRAVRVHFRSDYRNDSQTASIKILASNDPDFTAFEELASRGDDAVYPPGGVWTALIRPSGAHRFVRLAKTAANMVSLHEVEVFCPPGARAGESRAADEGGRAQ